MGRVIRWNTKRKGVKSAQASAAASIHLPARSEIDTAAQAGDLVALMDLDRQIREALRGTFSESDAREATNLLSVITNALRRFKVASLSDQQQRRTPSREDTDTTLPARVASAKAALAASTTRTLPTGDQRAAERAMRPVADRLADAKRALKAGR